MNTLPLLGTIASTACPTGPTGPTGPDCFPLHCWAKELFTESSALAELQCLALCIPVAYCCPVALLIFPLGKSQVACASFGWQMLTVSRGKEVQNIKQLVVQQNKQFDDALAKCVASKQLEAVYGNRLGRLLHGHFPSEHFLFKGHQQASLQTVGEQIVWENIAMAQNNIPPSIRLVTVATYVRIVIFCKLGPCAPIFLCCQDRNSPNLVIWALLKVRLFLTEEECYVRMWTCRFCRVFMGFWKEAALVLNLLKQD